MGTVKELVKVSNLSKFGFQIGTEFVNYSKQLPEGDKTRVVPGAEFEAELYVADSGKRYLNKILSGVAASSAKAVPPMAVSSIPGIDVERAKKYAPKPFVAKFEKKTELKSDAMTREDWDKKDVRISRQGCIQAAVHALGPVLAVDKLFDAAAKLADQMLGYVREGK